MKVKLIKTALVLLLFMPAVLFGKSLFPFQQLSKRYMHVNSKGYTLAMQKAGTKSLPLNAKDYDWDQGSNTWLHDSNTVHVYDARGRNIYDYIMDSSNFDTLYKIATTYDLNGSVFALTQAKGNGNWTNFTVDSAINDSHGSQYETIFYYWNNGSWVVIYGIQFKNTYDAGGHFTSETLSLNSGNGQWSDLEKVNVLSLYPDSSWKQLEIQTWDGYQWENKMLLDSLSWRNWNRNQNVLDGNPPFNSFYEKNWYNNQWVDSAKVTINWSSNNSSVETAQVLHGKKWADSTQDFNIYDSMNNLSIMKSQHMETGNWVVDYEYDYYHIYNGNGDLILDSSRAYNPSQFYGFVNQTMHIYSNYIYVAGIEKDAEPAIKLNVYPNPVSTSLALKAETFTSRNKLCIFDCFGRMVSENNYTKEELSVGVIIPVQNLNNGIYFVNIISGKNSSSLKFIKE